MAPLPTMSEETKTKVKRVLKFGAGAAAIILGVTLGLPALTAVLGTSAAASMCATTAGVVSGEISAAGVTAVEGVTATATANQQAVATALAESGVTCIDMKQNVLGAAQETAYTQINTAQMVADNAIQSAQNTGQSSGLLRRSMVNAAVGGTLVAGGTAAYMAYKDREPEA